MREQVIKAIEENKIIAIVRGVDVESALKTAKALCEGGIKLIEVTFNQAKPETFCKTVEAIRLISKEMQDEMIVGAGTVITEEQVRLAKEAGAKYIVSPDTDEKVIKLTVALDMVSLPGAYTASEAKKANVYGADFVKLFPCQENAPSYLKALRAPLSHVKFLAVGGVTIDNASDFIKAGAVGIGVGGALVNKEWIEKGEFDKLTDLAKQFVNKLK